MYGICGSSKVVRARKMRLLAWPRSPSKIKLCRERIALMICGTTVSSYPTIPGNIGPPWRSFAIRLSRNSSFTRRLRSCSSENGLWRNSPSVRGRLMIKKPPGRTAFWSRLYAPPILSRVSVAAGFAAYVYSAAHCGQDGFEERNDGLQALGFRFHPQQRLFEIEIKRKRSGEMKRELPFVDFRRFFWLRSGQGHNLAVELHGLHDLPLRRDPRFIVQVENLALQK